jgi:hypothetical protein
MRGGMFWLVTSVHFPRNEVGSEVKDLTGEFVLDLDDQ